MYKKETKLFSKSTKLNLHNLLLNESLSNQNSSNKFFKKENNLFTIVQTP